MDSAPLPSQHPPCDEDFKATFGEQAIIAEEQESASDEDDSGSDDFTPEVTEEFRKLSYNTSAELRKLQRIMIRVAETDEMGTAKASAARAWKELEILRCAKAGKPIMLHLTGKGDVPRKAGKGATMVVLDCADSSKVA